MGRNSGKPQELLAFLNREKVQDVLVVNGDMTRRIAAEIGVKAPHHIWTMLKRLEKRGAGFTRVSNGPRQGVTLHFGQAAVQRVVRPSGKMSGSAILARIDREIAALREQIAAKENARAEIVRILGEE